MCWSYVRNTQRLTECCFFLSSWESSLRPKAHQSGLMEKPRIKPVTPAVFFWCFFFVAFLGVNQFRRVCLRFVCWFYDGYTQRLTKNGFMEKQGIEPATPGLQGIGLSPTPQRLLFWCIFFVVFQRINKSAALVLDMYAGFMTATPKGSPKVVLWRSLESYLRPLVYNA